MRLQHAATLSEILNSSPLRNLVDRADELSKLEQCLSRVLDTRLQSQCRVLDYRDGVLVVGTSQSALAAQLRYLAPALIRRLREQLETAQVRSLRVQVTALPSSLAVVISPPHQLSDTAQQALLDAARLQDDPELSLAFQRLASAGKQKMGQP